MVVTRGVATLEWVYVLGPSRLKVQAEVTGLCLLNEAQEDLGDTPRP